jgi:hypothetical protein
MMAMAAGTWAQPLEPFQRWPQPQPTYHEESSLSEMDRYAADMGYAPDGIVRYGRGRAHQRSGFMAQLGPGRFMIQARCINGCANVDVDVLNQGTGQSIPPQSGTRFSVVAFSLPQPTDLSIGITIRDCQQLLCSYGWRIYQAQAALPPP